MKKETELSYEVLEAWLDFCEECEDMETLPVIDYDK